MFAFLQDSGGEGDEDGDEEEDLAEEGLILILSVGHVLPSVELHNAKY